MRWRIITAPRSRRRFEYEDDSTLPDGFELYQNYPNPFAETTTIAAELPTASEISLKVYDILGQEVVTLHDGTLNAGRSEFVFDASDLPSGAYFYMFRTEGTVKTNRMLVCETSPALFRVNDPVCAPLP